MTEASKGSLDSGKSEHDHIRSLLRPLNDEEFEVNQAVRHIFLEHQDVEAKVVDVSVALPAPTFEDAARFEPAEIPFQAISSVKEELEKEAPHSLHDKWIVPAIKDVIHENEWDVMERISAARLKIDGIKQMYRSLQAGLPKTAMQTEVDMLLATGKMVIAEGGSGGVYFLCDSEGTPKYVIKPVDEALLTINNGKKKASPLFDEDGKGAPKEGIRIYEAVQNADLASKAAEIFKLSQATPNTEVMILEHPLFHDILDGTVEKESREAKQLEEKMPTTREKVCSVQPFVSGFQDMGTFLATQGRVQSEYVKELFQKDREAYKAFEAIHSPRDIDHAQYESIAIFSFLIGEKDGNAGNFMCAEGPPMKEGKRLIYKIDNAASFPENNKDIVTGLSWVAYNYKFELSDKAKELIQNIDGSQIEQLKTLMRERKKSEESILAFEQRVRFLKEWSTKTESIEHLDLYFDLIEQGEEV